MSNCHFQRLSPELRLIIGKHLLEDAKHKREYCPTTIDMTFHPDSPFTLELRQLFPKLMICPTGIYYNSALVYRLPDNQTLTPFFDHMLSYLVELSTAACEPYHVQHPQFFTMLKPYAANFKRMELNIAHDLEHMWYQLVSTASHTLEELYLLYFNELIIEELLDIKEKSVKIKSLSLGYMNCTRSKCPDILSALLKAFGESLETLEFDQHFFEEEEPEYDDFNDILTVVCTHCPNLKDFRNLGRFMPITTYASLLMHYGPQVRQARLRFDFTPSNCIPILESCPNVLFSAESLLESSDSHDVLVVLAPRMNGCLSYRCGGLVGENIEKLQLCLRKLHDLSTIYLNVREEKREQTVFLDILAEANTPHLRSLYCSSPMLTTITLRKILPVVQGLRELHISWCSITGDEDTLLQICATGTNLESIVCGVFRARKRKQMLRVVRTFKMILSAIRSHPNLKHFEFQATRLETDSSRISKVLDELKDAVQCVRNRRVLLKFGNMYFLYGKCVASMTDSYAVSE